MTWFARLGDSDYEEDENGVRFHNRPRPPYLVPTLSQNERVSAPTLTDKTLRSQAKFDYWLGRGNSGSFLHRA